MSDLANEGARRSHHLSMMMVIIIMIMRMMTMTMIMIVMMIIISTCHFNTSDLAGVSVKIEDVSTYSFVFLCDWRIVFLRDLVNLICVCVLEKPNNAPLLDVLQLCFRSSNIVSYKLIPAKIANVGPN